MTHRHKHTKLYRYRIELECYECKEIMERVSPLGMYKMSHKCNKCGQEVEEEGKGCYPKFTETEDDLD